MSTSTTLIHPDTRNELPTEMLEREMPLILIREYALREDSGGAGRWRGGTGTIIEFETLSPYTTVTSRSMERYLFPPPGRLGGTPGTTGFTTLNPGSDRERDIGKIDILDLTAGDVLRIGTQGGGGFGDPLKRPPESGEPGEVPSVLSHWADTEPSHKKQCFGGSR